VPKGYFTFKSPTYNVFLFFRTIMKKGEDGPDPKPAVALAEQTRVYPLWALEKDVKPMVFPNGSGKQINMMYPVDNIFWTKLKRFADYEPVSAIDPELRGVLASIGIIKGQPFNPTGQQQALLKKAVETAPKMILAARQLGRPDGVSSITKTGVIRISGPVRRPIGCRTAIWMWTSGRPTSRSPMRRRPRW
jgi:hypothetical protein